MWIDVVNVMNTHNPVRIHGDGVGVSGGSVIIGADPGKHAGVLAGVGGQVDDCPGFVACIIGGAVGGVRVGSLAQAADVFQGQRKAIITLRHFLTTRPRQ